jgi:hypothetical protein
MAIHGPDDGHDENEDDALAVGVAIKLRGSDIDTAEQVLRRFHAQWLATLGPHRCAGVEIDRVHHSMLAWIDGLEDRSATRAAEASLREVVDHIADALDVEHARFVAVDVALEQAAAGLVLAGNPLRERIVGEGEGEAFAWAAAQRVWSPRELAEMIAEIVIELDPTQLESNATALRLCERGMGIDPEHPDLGGYRMQLLVERGDVGGAIAQVRSIPVLLAHLVGLVAERAPAKLGEVLDAIDAGVIAALPDELVEPLVVDVGMHAPARLDDILMAVPSDAAFVPALHAAASRLQGEPQMQVLDAVLALPRPDRSDEAAWADWLGTVNNACIHAHRLGRIARACEIADLAQDVAADHPHIFHAAACAYAAAGDPGRALAQCELAVRHGYEHLEALRVDTDLGPLLRTREFAALFEGH